MGVRVRKWKGSWWLAVYHNGARRMRRFGPSLADKRRAQRIAEQVAADLVKGNFDLDTIEEPEPPTPEEPAPPTPLPFDRYAEDWLRREVTGPAERGTGDHLALGTARSYAGHVHKHLSPHFASRDIRSINVAVVQAFHDHCLDRKRPKSSRTLNMVIATLGMVLSHARAAGEVSENSVTDWKRQRAGKGRRRSAQATVRPRVPLPCCSRNALR